MGLLLAYGPNAKPSFSGTPTISGAPLVNSVLTCHYTVARARTENVSVQWLGTVLSGQGETVLGTGITYIPSAADEGRQIRIAVTAVNNAGTVQSFSDYTSAIVNEDTPDASFTAGPTLTLDDGNTRLPALTFSQGEYLICSATVSSGTPTFQWFYDDDGAGTNKTNISSDAATQPLPYSQPNNWRSSCFVSTEVPVGKRVGCDATLGAVTSRAYMPGNLGAIEGTPISQSTVGAAPAPPYQLQNAGKYYLTEDLEFAGSAINIRRLATSLNLNGYTIRCNALTPPTVVNGDFESGTTGWDFTNAPNATIHEPVDAAAAYRLSELWTGTKSLRFDATQDEYVQSAASVELQGGVEYLLGALMAWGPWEGGITSPAVVGTLQLIESDGVTPVSGADTQYASAGAANSGAWNQRGMRYASLRFTPPSTGNYYIRISCNGTASAGAYGFYVDDVVVVRSRLSGVTFQTVADMQSDMTTASIGQIYQIRVRNGTIEEANRCASPYAVSGKLQRNGVVRGQQVRGGMTLSRLHLINRQDNAHCVVTTDTPADAFQNQIYNCQLTSNTLICADRDQQMSSVVYGLVGSIGYVNVDKAAANGIQAGANGGQIYGCNISMQARHTNSFAIVAPKGGKTFDNTILCGSGDNTARGIGAGSGGATELTKTEIYNNWVEVQEKGDLQEYRGGNKEGNWVLQAETPEYGSGGYLHVHDNVLIANSSALYGSHCIRTTIRSYSPYNETANNWTFENNDLRAYSTAATRPLAKSGCISQLGWGNITFSGNTLRTNDSVFFKSSDDGTTVLDGSLVYAESPVATPHAVRTGSGATGSVLQFINTTFQDAGSETYYNNAGVFDYESGNPSALVTITRTS